MERRERSPWRSSAVRIAAGCAIALCSLAVAACSASSTPTVATAANNHVAPSATVGTQDAALQFTACMRGKGIPMDDPDPQTGAIKPQGDAKALPDFSAAYAACKDLLSAGQRQQAPELSAAQLDTMRRFAQCMRDDGIPSYPDPGPHGWDQPSSIPTGPDVDSAFKKCSPIMGVSASAGTGGGVG